MTSAGKSPVRVLFCCTGVGIFNRGIETFFREAFDGLKSAEGIEARLIKGAEDAGNSERGMRNAAGTSPRPSPQSGEGEVVGRNAVSLNSQLSAINPLSNERVVWCLPRTGKLAPLIGRLTGRSAYAVEQWSSFPGVVREIRRFRPHVVFTSEANLMFLLRRFRRQIGVPFRVLYSNGGPVHPPFNRHDVVHQVAPLYRDEALAAGEPATKHLLVPYGIHVPPAPVADPTAKRALRERLGLPVDRPVILSVGWIAKQHKRMDYVVREVARTIEMLKSANPLIRPSATFSPSGGEARVEEEAERGQPGSGLQATCSQLPAPGSTPFLQLLGAMDEHSPEILELGVEQLGAGNFAAKSVRPDQVADYYRAADIFVLGSLKEGFGRVYLEALMHGLPTIGHRHPVIEYVLGDVGIVADLAKEGELAAALLYELQLLGREQGAMSKELEAGSNERLVNAPSFPLQAPSSPQFRRESVRSRFSWDVLRPHYVEMFRAAAEVSLHP